MCPHLLNKSILQNGCLAATGKTYSLNGGTRPYEQETSRLSMRGCGWKAYSMHGGSHSF